MIPGRSWSYLSSPNVVGLVTLSLALTILSMHARFYNRRATYWRRPLHLPSISSSYGESALVMSTDYGYVAINWVVLLHSTSPKSSLRYSIISHTHIHTHLLSFKVCFPFQLLLCVAIIYLHPSYCLNAEA
jgi:hypothetical protein